MIVDSSALIAILLKEKQSDAIFDVLMACPIAIMSVANYLETSIVISSRLPSLDLTGLDQLIEYAEITLVNVTAAHAKIARSAFLVYGKGHHKAALNFGDCFAYALAKERNLPLLFKGNDFSQTDIEMAQY